jgi:signal transduction histidine kinase
VKRLPKQSIVTMGVAAALGAILLVLAVLQYQWSGRISQAERERLEAGLRTAMSQFRQEFNRELQRVAQACQLPPASVATRDWQGYARRMDDWIRAAPEAQLVADLYIWSSGSDSGSQLLKLSRESGQFEHVPWPSHLDGVRERYAHALAGPVRSLPEFRPFAWRMIPQTPLLLAPLVEAQTAGGPLPANLRLAGFLVVEMNLDFLRTGFLPEVSQRYFGGPEGYVYQVAIISGRDPGTMIYGSDPSLTPSVFASSDARIALLGDPRALFGRRAAGGGRPDAIRRRDEEGPEGQALPPSGFAAARQNRARYWPLILPVNDGNDWELVAKHRQGSVEAAAAGLRRRALAVSFGILLLLALSVGIIVAYTQRAQRLAQLQMDFVAGVSHELRTPLAVICSAGDNLADGVVPDSSEKVRQYGELIRKEGRQLAAMVEQILQYASDRGGFRHYELKPARIAQVIEAALEKARAVIEMSGFTVEQSIEPDLPPVHVDVDALSQALHNLVINAIKYSGDSRWLSIKAKTASTKKGLEVQVAVEDRGMGITPADLPHIFNPFYRGTAAAEAQVHGTGLGLYTARKTVTAMGGSVRVRSTAGEGSVFTIHIPAHESWDASPLAAAETS